MGWCNLPMGTTLAVYGVLSYVIVWANRLWLLLFDRCQVGCDARCSCHSSSISGLYSFGICSGISSLFLCSVCMYICSVGSDSDRLLTPLRSVMVSVMFPYSCLLLRMYSAYEGRGSLFFMYLVCFWCLVFRLRFVCPTYALRQDLHMILWKHPTSLLTALFRNLCKHPTSIMNGQF